jgi:hypothetical protein
MDLRQLHEQERVILERTAQAFAKGLDRLRKAAGRREGAGKLGPLLDRVGKLEVLLDLRDRSGADFRRRSLKRPPFRSGQISTMK